jgi:hypothetical protein
MSKVTGSGAAAWSPRAASIAIGSTAIALIALLALHIVSPEFDPSWRMVSEYAYGNHGWLLSLFFATWAIGTWSLAASLRPLTATSLGRVGLGFLVLAGIGEMMAAFFDINHPMHGPAAMLGIPSLAVAAVLLSIAVRRQGTLPKIPMWSAHMPWMSIVVMAAAMMAFMMSLSRAGIAMDPANGPLTDLPPGAIAFVGWANRLLVASYCLWVILAARSVVRATAVRP